jgi:hypothetical protein
MNKNDLDPVSLTVYGSAVVAVISFFLPWLSAGMFGSANGFETGMFLLIIFWAPAIYTAITKNLVGAKTQNEIKLILNAGGGIIALIGIILFILIKGRVSTPFGSANLTAVGAYSFLLTTVALTFSNYLLFKRHN